MTSGTTSATEGSSSPTEGTSSTTYHVSGMTCAHCVSAVSEEIGKLDGVSGVEIDLTSGQVQVTSARPLAQADVAAAVDEAGYTLVA